MKHEELTATILKCCFEVSNELGAEFLESVYEKALIVALSQQGLNVNSQVGLKVNFRGVIVRDFYADLIVEERALIEIKAVSKLSQDHKAQVINYLNATGFEVGLLVNFGTSRVEFFRFRPSDHPEHPVNPV
ncbi:MAG: GxxExxY protein [Pyrinomonadaceae bacterium]